MANAKLDMSRALGAAYLTHKVAQLEKSVDNNWRERRTPNSWASPDHSRAFSAPKQRNDDLQDQAVRHSDAYKPDHLRRRSEDANAPKVADVIVLDASVLIYGLYHLKKWARDGREEIIIVPLEALNTLDLLKKGTSPLAQRARAASRILEAQVGTNPRIRVQKDDAFVLWDSIPFDDQNTALLSASPEWVRRTICCARWELQHAAEEYDDNKALNKDQQLHDNTSPSVGDKPSHAVPGVTNDKQLRVVLAVLSPSADPQLEHANSAAAASPVPLPAPQPNRYESRLSSALVARWAAKAGVEVLEVTPAPPSTNAASGAPEPLAAKGRRSGEGTRRFGPDDGAKRVPAGRGRRNSRSNTPGHRPPTIDNDIVVRPAAVKVMMEAVNQNRVVRVLSRNEKLP